MGHPAPKQIGEMRVSVDLNGYPYWTRINLNRIDVLLDHEEARDLLYAMQRIVAFLDSQKDT